MKLRLLCNCSRHIVCRTGAIGTGVEVVKIKRIFDGFLKVIREANVTLGYWEGLQQVLTEIESVFWSRLMWDGEDLTRFFLAWDDLSSRPEGTPLRAALVVNQNFGFHINRITRNLRGYPLILMWNFQRKSMR